VLWLLEDKTEAAAALVAAAQRMESATQRLVFAPGALELQASILPATCRDLFLDSWPCKRTHHGQ